MPSRYSVLNTCFLSFFRLNEEARCNLQFRMHQNVAFSQILWPRTDKYDMKVWFGIFFWTLTPSHFFMSLANLSGGEFVLLWSWKQIVVKQCWKSSLMFKKHAMTVKSAQLSDYKCRIAEKAKHSLTLWAKDIAYFITRDKRICVLKFKTQAWWGDEGKIDINKRHCLILWEIQKQQKKIQVWLLCISVGNSLNY